MYREKKGQGGGARHDFCLAWLAAEPNRVQKSCVLLYHSSTEFESAVLSLFTGERGSQFRRQESNLLLLCHGMLPTVNANLLVT
jgi:hypothetical protein